MNKKESKETENGSNELEVSEVIEPSNQFDLSVLKSTIENAEKERKELIQEKLINQANFQKETENIPETEEEKTQDFNETLVEFLEFCFSFANRKLEKVDVSKFDDKFITELIEKLTAVISKSQMNKIYEYIGAGNKLDSSKRLFRISKFLMFISQEIFERFDEYNMYRKAHGKSKLFAIKDKKA